jgi:hypothetical protein
MSMSSWALSRSAARGPAQTWNKRGPALRTDAAVAGSPPSVISRFGGYVPPVPEQSFQNAGMRHYYAPRDGSPTRDSSTYTTTQLAAQEPARQAWADESGGPRACAPRMTNHGDRFYSDDSFYHQTQQQQPPPTPPRERGRPHAVRPPATTPPDSERSQRSQRSMTPPASDRRRAYEHHRQHNGQPFLDATQPARGQSNKHGDFKPSLQPGTQAAA